ncbi:hypothetical protein [Methylohalobius crimeensis]|uniref:hypothetical protein n=1 Tax=Methylohalobius crimeensis TaxID=244365 RepID=UPI0003B72606|nr:hypothetical protein [Methylohalobius crimeensis]
MKYLPLLLILAGLPAQAEETTEADLFEDESEAPLFQPAEEETLQLDGEEGDSLFAEEVVESESESAPPLPVEISGQSALEYRFFHDHGENPGMDYHNNFSFYLEPKFAYLWDGNRQSLTFKPFWRYDQHDSRRTHFDIREMVWRFTRGPWTFRAGIDRVFWGVTESRHTVDIINQTDLIENSDTEEKLGQPMLRLDYSSLRWGTASLFYLPFSRKRTFPGKEGRLRPPLPITDSADHPDSARPTHPDFAIRWAKTLGYWDVGLTYFRGVTREPRFEIGLTPDFQPVNLRPVYEVIDQVGLDIQGVTGNWLWKLEGFHRAGQGKSFQQLTAGFEYTFSGVFKTGADLGFLAEFLYDNRENQLPLVNFIPFEKDIFVGSRLALNDVSGTELLAGAIIDFDTGTTSYNIEASRRFGNHWKLYLEMRGFVNTDPKDAGYFFRRENYIHTELQYYF